MLAVAQQDRATDERWFDNLVDVVECIVDHHDCGDLFTDLPPRLHQLVSFDFLQLALYNPSSQMMRQNVLESPIKGSPVSLPRELPIEESLAALVWQSQQPLLWNDISRECRARQIVAFLRSNGVRSYCLMPLSTPQQQLGAIGFGSTTESAYETRELIFLKKIADVVAVAVASVLHYEWAHAYEEQLKHDRDRLEMLLKLTTAVSRNLELRDCLP